MNILLCQDPFGPQPPAESLKSNDIVSKEFLGRFHHFIAWRYIQGIGQADNRLKMIGHDQMQERSATAWKLLDDVFESAQLFFVQPG
jgi:hypothetical protein